MKTRPWGRALALLSLVILGTACETGTGPDGGDGFRATLDDYAALEAALSSSGFAGFKALGDRTPYSASAQMSTITQMDGSPAFAQSLTAGLSGGPATAPIISETHRGRTFVYDPAKDDYVIDPARTGAPSTGVRFIIYRVDSAGRPIVGQEIGYAELIDEGDSSAQDVALRFTVVQNGDRILDYRTTLDDSPTRGALAVHGYLSGDGVRLDFDIEATSRKLASGNELDIAFEMAIDARDFSIVGSVHGIEGGPEGDGDVDLTVRHRDHSIRVDVTGGNGEVDGTVFVNGDVFATITGEKDSPTVLDKDGEPIGGVQALVLLRIMDSLEDVWDLLEDLLDPVDDLVFWGLVL
jgi:hypothetical protein